jgi:hypothetical protein
MVMKQSPISIETFIKNNWFEEIKDTKPSQENKPSQSVIDNPVEKIEEISMEAVKPPEIIIPVQPKIKQPKPAPKLKPIDKIAEVIGTGSTEKDTNKLEDTII